MRRYNVERSCIRCHERKVRCNKSNPCATCVRASVPCRYPGPERTKRRSQKPAHVGPRLEVLERAVAAINSPKGPVTGRDVTPSQNPATASVSPESSVASRHARHVPSSSESGGGFLLKDGSSTRYIDEITFARVLDKQDELQSAIDTPESHHSSDERPSSIGFHGLLLGAHRPHDILPLFPSLGQASRLWQIYLNNVGCLVKLLHIPSVQPLFFAAINNPRDAPHDMNALIFSIFFAATASLSSPDVQSLLHQDREVALDTFQRGLEVCLHLGSFLDSPTVVSLQAMAIYLACRRALSSGRSGWILNGLVIRAAQAIGLHRDGKHFKLSPLDCEIRRRLWWLILGSDGRAAEDHGLSAGLTGVICDTKLPAHVDDRDISPAMTTAPASQRQWTEMTHFLVASEMYQSLQEFNRLATQRGDDKMDSLEQFLSNVKTRMEDRYLQYCDSNIPIQKASLLLGRVLLGKLELLVRQQNLHGLNAEESAGRVNDEMLTLACDTIELGIQLKTDELLSNFQWIFSAFREYHVLTYTLWHLWVRPDAVGADRAWNIVDRLFTLAETRGWPTPGSKWNVMCKLREKAAGTRQILSGQASRNNTAAAGDLMVAELQQVDQALLDATGNALMSVDGVIWDFESLYFPGLIGLASEF